MIRREVYFSNWRAETKSRRSVFGCWEFRFTVLIDEIGRLLRCEIDPAHRRAQSSILCAMFGRGMDDKLDRALGIVLGHIQFIFLAIGASAGRQRFGQLLIFLGRKGFSRLLLGCRFPPTGPRCSNFANSGHSETSFARPDTGALSCNFSTPRRRRTWNLAFLGFRLRDILKGNLLLSSGTAQNVRARLRRTSSDHKVVRS